MKSENDAIDVLLGSERFKQFMHCYEQNKVYKCPFETLKSALTGNAAACLSERIVHQAVNSCFFRE